MIPHTLHQIWIGPNPRPPEHQKYLQHFQKLHPDWTHKLWTEENINELEIPVTLDSWTEYSSKANAIRICAILKHGGMYADTDIQFLKNLNQLMNCRSWAILQHPGFYFNGLFASQPQEPFLKEAERTLQDYIGRIPPWGPVHLTHTLKKHPIDITLPTHLFLPYSYGYGKQPAENFPDAYTCHHWEMSWKQPTPQPKRA